MNNQPLTFSIVVPAYHRREGLVKCLKALTALSYPADRYEIIVVDDGSPNPLKSVADSYRESKNIRFFRQENSGPATARNYGASVAKGKFLAFTDDDCTPAADWLKVLAHQFAKKPDYMIGGQVVNTYKNNLYSNASQELILYLYDYYEADESRDRFFTSNNLAIPTEMFKAIGGFDTSFPLPAAEDRELCSRWRYHGHKMIYTREAMVYHSHAMTLNSFSRQHFNYGRGAYTYHKTRSKRNQSLIKPEPITFYVNLLLYPFSKSHTIFSLLTIIILALSQVANICGFFFEKARQTQKNNRGSVTLPNPQVTKLGEELRE